ncbi:MAG: AAA domain-containing protein [Candidatus Hodarchaeota archaeon]
MKLNRRELAQNNRGQGRLSEIKTFDDPSAEEWFEAINQEQMVNQKQSWNEAVPVTLTSVKRRDDDCLLFMKLENKMPSWVKEGKIVSIGQKQQKTKLTEGKILVIGEREENSKTRLCMLKVKQREIEKIIVQERKQWLLPFSCVPYNLMRESVMKILLKNDASIAKELLIGENITSNSLDVIQGPPGTGKTTTIGELCLELYDQYGRKKQGINQDSKMKNLPKVLLTAFTHKACVNLAEKLDELKIPFITINIRGMSNHLQEKYDLDHVTNRALHNLKKIRSRNNILNWKRHKKAIQRQIVDQIMFIICTSLSAPKRFNGKKQSPFQLTIVDEGSQMPLPILAGVVSLSEDTIVFGDPIQLPPVVIAPLLGNEERSKINPLTHTVYDKIQREQVKLLDKQFRGRPEIFMLVSGLFYDGQIHMGQYIPRLFDYPAIEFIDTSSYDPQEYNRVNYLEAKICQDLLDELAAKSSHPMKVGVITPFYAQAAYLRRMLHTPPPSLQLDIGTVHVAQGRSYDCVILSLGATTPSPFLNPPKKWIFHLKQHLELICHRLKREALSIKELQYPNYKTQLQHVYDCWSEQLEPFNEENGNRTKDSLRLRLFQDAEMDFIFDLDVNENLPENDFAPNIFNVALSRARNRLVVLGHYNVLHQNPIVNLIYSWAEIFGQVTLLE